MSLPFSTALAELRKRFAEQLPGRLEAIQSQYRRLLPDAWQVEEVETLHRLVHGLTGSAGTFGMNSVSDAARTLESRLMALLRSGQPADSKARQEIELALTRLETTTRLQLSSDEPSQAPNLPTLQQPERSPLIYLVEDDAQQVLYLSQLLKDEGFRVRVFASLNDFRAARLVTDQELPSAVVMDMVFPESETGGADVIAELKVAESACPPLLFVSSRDDLSARLAAYRAGACSYLVKPVNSERLLQLLDEVTGRIPATPYRILLVDDDVLLLDAYASMLRAAGMTVQTVSQPLQTLDVLQAFKPDVVVLDMYMPEVSGPELAAILRSREESANLPILFLSSEGDIGKQLLALNLGGDDFMVRPVQPEYFVAMVTTRARRGRHEDHTMRHLKKALYEREREHQALDQHALVSIADAAGLIIYVNDNFCTLSGYSREELLGKDHRIVKSDIHPPEFYREMWTILASGNIWQGEICNRSKNGSLYWVSASITPFLDSEGKPYQYVSIRTDITSLKESQQALKLSQEYLQLQIERMPVGYILWDQDFRVTAWNPEAARIFGYSAEEAMGKHPYEFIVPSEARPVVDEIWGRVLKGDEGASIDNENIRKDGQTILCEWVNTPIHGADGRTSSVLSMVQDITERRRAEQELAESKERLRRGQFFANIGTWDWNIENGELFWTERIAPLFGYPAGELETSYANFINAVHPDDRQALNDAITACVEHDVPYVIEHRVVWPDGTVRWLLERGDVMRDSSGKAVQMLGVVQDIDDRKRAELALADREQQLREAQTLAHIGNWRADMGTGKLTWSDEIYRIFGREIGHFEPSVEAFFAAVHPDDQLIVKESERRAEVTGIHDVEHRIVRPDGTVRYVHELARAEHDSEGRLTCMLGTVQDVTHRVEAEAKLRESEARFSFAVEGAGDGIWDWNMLSGAMPLSGHYESMLGYQPGELEPTIDAWMKSVHPGDLLRVQQSMQDYLAGKLTAYVVELRLRCKDGSYKWILCRGTVVGRDDDGKALRMIGIHSDISERKANEIALVEAREAAESANRAKSEFLSSMSHELRTPMNAILGFGQMLELDNGLNHDQKDNVFEILKAGQHLLELINEVLDLAKVESGRIDLSLEPVELAGMAEECRSLLQPLASARKIAFVLDLPPGEGVRADRVRLKQVLLNLLSNALKYNKEGGEIRLSVQSATAGFLRIKVSDTGMGIPAERLGDLFQPFSRLVSDNSEIEGTGIGLTISRRLVEMMGGQMGVESQLGIGTTFWLELPLENLQSGASQSEKMAAVSEQFSSERDHHILCIDDNPVNLKLLAQILAKRQHIHLFTAHSPEQGIQIAKAHLPELILLDINMPGMDGYKVLEKLQADDQLKSIQVVAVTANALPRDVDRGLAAGFAAYVTKPIDIERFLAIVDRCLDDPRNLS